MPSGSIPLAEPMAIISMGCRLPGGVSSPSSLWTMLENAESGRCKIPADRFNAGAFLSSGEIKTDYGYFIDNDLTKFDPGFFGLSPLEAASMDPQQRKFLEVCYETLESAGQTLQAMRGSNTGVFVGNFTSDWKTMLERDLDTMPMHGFSGGGVTMLSNRVSYIFHLNGPSITLDTACSSSLYALNYACAAIERGECTAALVGGTNLILTPEGYITETKTGALSPTGACHTFDESADGYARADGVGAVYIKKLSDALAEGCPIRAIIRATATNANDHSHNIMTPYQPTQEAVIRQAYRRAGIKNLSETGYFETHGTGTPVGDPIEVKAIRGVFGSILSEDAPLLIGSVKTNLGHSEAASGIASIIKVVLALEAGSIPPTIGIKKLNPKIDFRGIKVVIENTKWPEKPVRRASLNSFGYGGANAHVILESADSVIRGLIPRHTLAAKPANTRAVSLSSISLRNTSGDIEGHMRALHDTVAHANGTHTTVHAFLYPFSAQSKASLSMISSQILKVADCYEPRDLLNTLVAYRSFWENRAYSIISPGASSYQVAEVHSGKSEQEISRVIFCFTGQGAQWPQAAVALLDNYKVFSSTIAELDSFLAMELPDPPQWYIKDVIRAPAENSTINDPIVSQPVSVAVQIGLVDLLSSWNIAPSIVVGHSSGELAAAYCAGYISKQQAIIAAYYRGTAVQPRAFDGAMLAVALGADAVLPYLTEGVEIACYNSPQSVTLSGNKDAIETTMSLLKENDIFARLLKTGGNAYHSKQMKEVGPGYEASATTLYDRFRICKGAKNQGITMVSSVTGGIIRPEDFNMAYWRRNLESPVRFDQAIATLLDSAHAQYPQQFVEVGFHNVLQGPLRQIQEAAEVKPLIPYQSTLRRGHQSVTTMLHLAGELWQKGYPVRLDKVNQLDEESNLKICVDLPGYPWSYDQGLALSYSNRWINEHRFNTYGKHELLGTKVPGGSVASNLWRRVLRVDDLDWLRDHKLGDNVVFPAAGYLCMTTAAALQLLHLEEPIHGPVSICFRDVCFKAGLHITEEATEILTSLSPKALGVTRYSQAAFDFRIHSYDSSGNWNEHCCGSVAVHFSTPDIFTPHSGTPQEEVSAASWYKKFTDVGLNYGDSFQRLKNIRTSPELPKEAVAELDLYDQTRPFQHVLHPTEIDACLQLGIIASYRGRYQAATHGYVAFSVDEISMFISASNSLKVERLVVSTVAEKCGLRAVSLNTTVHDPSGERPIFSIRNLKAISGQGLIQSQHRAEDEREPYVRCIWKPDISLITQETVGEAFPTSQNPVLRLWDTLAHRDPKMDVLEIGIAEAGPSKHIMEELRTQDPRRRRVSSYTYSLHSSEMATDRNEFSTIDLNKSLESQNMKGQSFDVVLVTHLACPVSYLERIRWLLKPGGFIILVQKLTDMSSHPILLSQFGQAGFSEWNITLKNPFSDSILHVSKTPTRNDITSTTAKTILVVYRHKPVHFADVLESCIKERGWICARSSLGSPDLRDTGRRETHVVVVAELEGPVMLSLSEAELSGIKTITSNAASVSWITRGSLLTGCEPELALMGGCARSIRNEVPALLFRIFDFDCDTRESTVCNTVLDAIQNSNTEKGELEYIFQRGVANIPRLYPDYSLNDMLRETTSKAPIPREQPLHNSRLQIDLERVTLGSIDTFFFAPDHVKETEPLRDHDVEIDVKVFGLNMKEIFILMGHVDYDQFPNEFAGIVTRVGACVDTVAPGDRVLALGEGLFNSYMRTLDVLCIQLQEEETFRAMATLPISYITVAYSLLEFAKLEANETVLIHQGSGALGLAAIQLAKMVGAEIITTVSTPEKRQFLQDKFGIPDSHILQSRDSSFAPAIMKLTNGLGVDVVLSAVSGDLLNATWSCIAPFGRFAEVGRRDINDRGKLDLYQFKSSAAFTSFDLQQLMTQRPRIISRILHLIVDLIRVGKIIPITPATNFDISQFQSAVRYLMAGSHMGKVTLSLEDCSSVIKVLPAKTPHIFRSDASYLLIGALGGLGRSLAMSMSERGAKHFIFMSRTGTDKPAAKALVNDFRSRGIDATVIRGDVSKLEDVKRAAASGSFPVKGVVQAAMVINDSYFDLMTLEKWNATVLPKVRGTQNLHEVFADKELDFFTLTSSISATIGPPAQANYCAANAFLDTFARHRAAAGLASNSIQIGMVLGVGYVHEHLELEKALRKNGVRGLSEAEFLDAMDVCMRPDDPVSRDRMATSYDPDSRLLLITGMEMDQAVKSQNAEQWADSMEGTWRERDMRFSLLYRGAEKASTTGKRDARNRRGTGAVGTKLSALLRIPLETMEMGQTLAALGLDSIVAAEFRTWLYRELGVEISFLELLGPSMTVDALEAKVVAASDT